jgi:hypothetical protein
MDASHPDTLCGSVTDPIRPVSAVPGAQRGPKRGPKMRIVTFWPFRAPKRPRGRSSSKHKSYLRYRDSLWRFNRDLIFFRFGSRTFACCADMGPPTGNRGAPGATSGPLFPFHIFNNLTGLDPFSAAVFAWRPNWHFRIGPGPPGAQKRAKMALLGPPT